MRKKVCSITFMLMMLCAPLSVSAHHSHASLDPDRVQTWEGIVTAYLWRSPHVYLKINAPNDDGVMVEYSVEALNPTGMSRFGWDRDTFGEGDFIRWHGNPDRTPGRPYTGILWAENASGERRYADRIAARDAGATPVPDSEVTPAKAIGEGVWFRIAADGSRHPFIRSPSPDWPVNERGQAVIDRFNEHDAPLNRCEYPGPSRSILTVYGTVWSRPDESRIHIHQDMNPDPRVVHLDPDVPTPAPSIAGHSIGRFDGDELIVETDNFVETQWGHYTGIDSSAEKRLTERYWLSEEGMRLNVEVTVEDPVYLSRPYSFTHQWRKGAERGPIEAPCSEEISNLYLTAGIDSGGSGAAMADEPASEPTARNLKMFFPLAVIIAILLGVAFRRMRSA